MEAEAKINSKGFIASDEAGPSSRKFCRQPDPDDIRQVRTSSTGMVESASPRRLIRLAAPNSTLRRVSRQPDPDDIRQEDLVTVRVKSENGDGNKRIQKEMHKLKVICKKCRQLLREETSALQKKCSCAFGLIHEKCKMKECDVCSKVVQYIPVTLSRSSGEKKEENNTHPKRFGNWCKKLLRSKNG